MHNMFYVAGQCNLYKDTTLSTSHKQAACDEDSAWLREWAALNQQSSAAVCVRKPDQCRNVL